MKCHTCGADFREVMTDMPFKLSKKTILILKELPVLQCEGCGEFMIDDPVMKRAEAIIAGIDSAAEVEIVQFAA